MFRAWIVGTTDESHWSHLDPVHTFRIGVDLDTMQLTVGLRDLPPENAEAAAVSVWRTLEGAWLVVLSDEASYLLEPSGEKTDVPSSVTEGSRAIKRLEIFCADHGCVLVSEESMRLPVGGYRLAEPGSGVGVGKIRGEGGFVDQTRERFVIGKGRDEDGERFFGIWDRLNPSTPERYPATPEGAAEAASRYSELIRGRRKKRRLPR